MCTDSLGDNNKLIITSHIITSSILSFLLSLLLLCLRTIKDQMLS